METHVVARTERQILRHLVPDDAADMFALSADPEVMRFLPDEPFASVEAARRFLEGYDPYTTEGMGRWAAIEAGTRTFLGWCGLRRQADGEVDLGYRYRRASWGQGLATEASRACIALAFGPMRLERIVAHAHQDNVASARVLEKLGFRATGDAVHAGLPVRFFHLDAPRPPG
jgi:ribosomal-protein-alanine N-acetyltransferase